jgi:hypothetical protein
MSHLPRFLEPIFPLFLLVCHPAPRPFHLLNARITAGLYPGTTSKLVNIRALFSAVRTLYDCLLVNVFDRICYLPCLRASVHCARYTASPSSKRGVHSTQILPSLAWHGAPAAEALYTTHNADRGVNGDDLCAVFASFMIIER